MNREKELTTILTIVTGLLILGFIFHLNQLFIAASIVAVLSLLSRIITRYIHIAWFKLAEFLGKISSTIILTVVYSLVLVPVSSLYKLVKGDTLSLKDSKRDTLWHIRNKTYTSDDLKEMW